MDRCVKYASPPHIDILLPKGNLDACLHNVRTQTFRPKGMGRWAPVNVVQDLGARGTKLHTKQTCSPSSAVSGGRGPRVTGAEDPCPVPWSPCPASPRRILRSLGTPGNPWIRTKAPSHFFTDSCFPGVSIMRQSNESCLSRRRQRRGREPLGSG